MKSNFKNSIVMDKSKDDFYYFKNKTNCIEPVDDSLPSQSKIKTLNIASKKLDAKPLNIISIKELIEIANSIRIEYVKKLGNYYNVHSYINVSAFDYFDNSINHNDEIDFCKFIRVFLDKNNEVYFIRTYSNNMEYPRLLIYPFFYNEFTYGYCYEGSSYYDVVGKKIVTQDDAADNNFIFIDKVNKLRLCFGVESSGHGYSNSNPIYWPRLFVLDANLYPVYYIRFRFFSLEKSGIDIENIFKIDYYTGTKYVKKYHELDFSGLGKNIIYNDTAKYQSIVDFVKLLIEKGNNLPDAKNGYDGRSIGYSEKDYPISFDTLFFPPVPEWAK
jgi:hypothetical protein